MINSDLTFDRIVKHRQEQLISLEYEITHSLFLYTVFQGPIVGRGGSVAPVVGRGGSIARADRAASSVAPK